MSASQSHPAKSTFDKSRAGDSQEPFQRYIDLVSVLNGVGEPNAWTLAMTCFALWRMYNAFT
jgi:hypothetical protein